MYVGNKTNFGGAKTSENSFGQAFLKGFGSGMSGIGNLGNLFGDWLQFDRQKQLYNLQRQDALSDYAMQRNDYLSDLASERAYNSPLAQVARLKAAGINPNVAFGSGSPANTSSGAENTSGVRGAVAASPATRSSGGFGSAFLQDMAGLISSGTDMAQARALHADLAVKNATVLKMLSEVKGIDEKTKAQEIENGWLDFMYESEINERYQRISESIDRMNTAAIERSNMIFDLKSIKPAQLEHIQSQTSLAYSRVQEIAQQMSHFENIKDYKVRQESALALEKEMDSAIASFEKELKAIGVPSQEKNKFHGFISEQVQRLKLLREAIISINFGN